MLKSETRSGCVIKATDSLTERHLSQQASLIYSHSCSNGTESFPLRLMLFTKRWIKFYNWQELGGNMEALLCFLTHILMLLMKMNWVSWESKTRWHINSITRCVRNVKILQLPASIYPRFGNNIFGRTLYPQGNQVSQNISFWKGCPLLLKKDSGLSDQIQANLFHSQMGPRD